jgi:hypothetical protein
VSFDPRVSCSGSHRQSQLQHAVAGATQSPLCSVRLFEVHKSQCLRLDGVYIMRRSTSRRPEDGACLSTLSSRPQSLPSPAAPAGPNPVLQEHEKLPGELKHVASLSQCCSNHAALAACIHKSNEQKKMCHLRSFLAFVDVGTGDLVAQDICTGLVERLEPPEALTKVRPPGVSALCRSFRALFSCLHQ